MRGVRALQFGRLKDAHAVIDEELSQGAKSFLIVSLREYDDGEAYAYRWIGAPLGNARVALISVHLSVTAACNHVEEYS